VKKDPWWGSSHVALNQQHKQKCKPREWWDLMSLEISQPSWTLRRGESCLELLCEKEGKESDSHWRYRLCLSSFPLSRRNPIKDECTNTDGFTLGTILSRTDPMQRQLPGMGANYRLLIWLLQYPVRQMMKRKKLQVEVFGFSFCQVETLKHRTLCVQETKYGFYCFGVLANSET
jgi:hypothetical protein